VGPARVRNSFSEARDKRSMETTQQEWDKLLTAANGGNGFAIDHIVEGRLRHALPASLREAYKDQCFLMWSRDGEYADDVKAAAAAHDPTESAAFRDEDVSVLDVRFVDVASACKFIGLGVEGDYDISISFQKRSAKPIRMLLREEEGIGADGDKFERSKMWEASGFKLVREWTPRSSIASVRSRTSLDGRPPTKAQNENFKGRSVVYAIRTLTQKMQNKSGRGAEASLEVRFGLREPLPDAEDSSLVVRVSTCGRILTRAEKGCFSIRAASLVRIASTAGACSLIDCDAGGHREGSAVYCNWQFGGHMFECGRTAVTPLGSPSAELSTTSFWLLAARVIRTMTIDWDNELTDASEAEDKRGFRAKFLRIFSDNRSARPVLSHKRMDVCFMGDSTFIDRLERQGILRRVRKNNVSWNKTLTDNMKVHRASMVASARF
jgi:hypothetical protein